MVYGASAFGHRTKTLSAKCAPFNSPINGFNYCNLSDFNGHIAEPSSLYRYNFFFFMLCMCSVGVSLPFRSHSLERSFADRYSEITAMSYRDCYRTAHRCPSMCSIHTNTHTQAQANEIYFIIATAHFYIQILLVALQCGYYALSAFNSNSSQPKPDGVDDKKK